MIGAAVEFLSLSVVSGDAYYYTSSYARVAQDGWSQVLPEYPLPVVVAFWPLHLLSQLEIPAPAALLAALLIADLAFSSFLHRRLGMVPLQVWVWGVVLLGPVGLQRLDLVPGVLLGMSVLAAGPVATGGLLALGTAAKVFPLIGLPAALATSARPSRVLVSAVTVGVAVASASVALGGWERLLSPLTYQSSRGLQVESIAATPFVLARLADPARWQTTFATSKSNEIAGPGTDVALALLQPVQVMVLLCAVVLAAFTYRQLRRASTPVAPAAVRATLVWSTIFVVSGLIVTSRVFSPQYLLWVLPLVAVAAAASDPGVRRWTTTFAVVLLLTQVLFPCLYGGLTQESGAMWPAAVVALIRNLLFVVLTIAALRTAALSARSLTGDTASPTGDAAATRSG